MRFPIRHSAISLGFLIITATSSAGPNGAALAQSGAEAVIGLSKPRAVSSLNQQRPAFAARPNLILDESDEIATLQAIQTALQTVGDGGAYVWQRGHGLLDGIIRPTTSFKDRTGEICRHIVIRLSSGRYSREAEGIACRDDSGGWALTN